MKIRPSDLKSRNIKNIVIYTYNDFSFTYHTALNKVVYDNKLSTVANEITNKTQAKAAIIEFLSSGCE